MSTDIIDFLSHRVSCPRLEAPAPDAALLKRVFQCALRAPDHMMLRPWRYLVIEAGQREALGLLFEAGAVKDDPDLTQAQRDKFRQMPMRAPMIVVAISENKPHPKVPVDEQMLSCGVGMGYMLLALQAAGFNGIWRTGPLAENAAVKAGLGLESHETLVGFLYLGTPAGELKSVPELAVEDFFQTWEGPST